MMHDTGDRWAPPNHPGGIIIPHRPPDQPPRDPSEQHWALNRPRHHRVPTPTVGDHVYYRHHEWGPAEPAQVVRILDPMPDDPNVYRYVLDETRRGRPPILDGAGRRIMALAPDPDPEVELHTTHGRVITREARLRGSPGWLPLDWQHRWRPDGPILPTRVGRPAGLQP